MLLAAAGLPAYDAGKLNSGAGSGSVGSGGGGGTPTASSVASRPSAASALMKTLSVRLHRGTEFIKDTVQKALVMSAPTPVASVPTASVAPLTTLKIIDAQGVKRKLSGAGGLMGCSGISSITSISASTSRPHYILAPISHSHVQVPPNVPTAAFLRTYTVAPTALHRSASARKRNPSTDSLLMDLCLFKPIRPMPITPIKINKFRSFELKRPKFVPATNPDSEEDEEEDDDESVHKPKLSNLTLPTKEGSAFVPMPYIETTTNTAIIATNTSSSTTTTTTCSSSRSRSRSHNTHTSGSAHAITNPNPNPKPKRRRRAPKLTIKRRRKAPEMKSTSPADGGTEAKVQAKRKAAAVAVAAATSGEATASNTPPISSPAVVKKSAAKRKATSECGHAKRSRGGSPLTTTSTSSADGATAAKSTSNRKSATGKGAVAPAKRSRGSSEASPPASRPSPPMTRQRARQQISASK